MNYSIIKVEGLSMKPFLISDDYVLVSDNFAKSSSKEIGECLYLSDTVHRLISNNQTKGDRLIYVDPFDVSSNDVRIVLGRVLSKKIDHNNKLDVSDYHHPVLIFISKILSFLSKKNIEQSKFRFFILINIFIFAKTHRSLERIFTLNVRNK
jgi:signal peptidase I